MAYSEKMAGRVREALSHLSKVEEKKMFRGMTFMVDGKMCVNLSGENLMLRIDPQEQSHPLPLSVVLPSSIVARLLKSIPEGLKATGRTEAKSIKMTFFDNRKNILAPGRLYGL